MAVKQKYNGDILNSENRWMRFMDFISYNNRKTKGHMTFHTELYDHLMKQIKYDLQKKMVNVCIDLILQMIETTKHIRMSSEMDNYQVPSYNH